MYPSVSDYNDANPAEVRQARASTPLEGHAQIGPARFLPEADVLVLGAKQRPPPQWPTKRSREGCSSACQQWRPR
jgi:hypothetical protein